MGSSTLDGFVAGQVEGTGNAIDIELRFTPRYVELMNVDGDVKVEWDHTMANGAGYKITYGSAYAMITTGGVTPKELSQLEDYSSGSSYRGFQIGTDADLNVSSETIHYRAWE